MKLRKNFSLKNQTTFRIGGRAKYFCIVKNKDDLIRAVQEAKRIKVSFFVWVEEAMFCFRIKDIMVWWQNVR